MFGKRKRQIENVIFVQPPKGEAYFYTPIAYATTLPNSKEDEGEQVFKDSDLALAGKLKLIFEREKMVWFEIREGKSKTRLDEPRFFALYYYPHRLVTSRSPPSVGKATLTEIRALFDFLVTQDQNRLAELQQNGSASAYDCAPGEQVEESETVTIVAGDPWEESETAPVITNNSKR